MLVPLQGSLELLPQFRVSKLTFQGGTPFLGSCQHYQVFTLSQTLPDAGSSAMNKTDAVLALMDFKIQC